MTGYRGRFSFFYLVGAVRQEKDLKAYRLKGKKENWLLSTDDKTPYRKVQRFYKKAPRLISQL